MNRKAIWICVTVAAMGIGTAAAAANGVRNERKAEAAEVNKPAAKKGHLLPAKHSHRSAKRDAQSARATARPHGADTRHLKPVRKVEKKPTFNSLKLSRIEQRQV